MEVPVSALLYAILLAATVFTLLYVFNVYNNAVYQINYAACREITTLIEAALQTAQADIYNYTGSIHLYYPVVFIYHNTSHILYIVVGRDTLQPAECELSLPSGVQSYNGTGMNITISKRVIGYGPCDESELPAIGVLNGEFLVVSKCEPGIQTARYMVEVAVG